MSSSPKSLVFSEFLKWASSIGVSEEQAEDANRKRTRLLDALDRLEVRKAFRGSKLFSRELSPGCELCCEGSWSCVFLTKRCTANCFFCPSGSEPAGAFPRTNRISVPDLNSYTSFLEYFGFRGVSFSGGEPLLQLGETLTWIEKIKERLGEDVYIWLYTNGDLVAAENLKALRKAGLDEIRINIAARGYDLSPVVLAREFLNKVTVEIPVIPEDYCILRERLVDMDRLGVDYLNLHQLFANQNNFTHLKRSDYTFMPLLGSSAPVFESEITALRLLESSLDSGVKLAINYCSSPYRSRADGLAHRGRAIDATGPDRCQRTEMGYLRRLSLEGSGEAIDLSSALSDEYSGEKKLVSYYERAIFSEVDPIEEFFVPVKEVEIADQFSIRVKERLVFPPREISETELLELTSDQPLSANPPGDLDDEGSISNYEVGSTGLQEIYGCQSLLDI